MLVVHDVCLCKWKGVGGKEREADNLYIMFFWGVFLVYISMIHKYS